MSAARIAALVRRNAIACETAKGPVCHCHCGGVHHGQKHSREWIESTIEELLVSPQQNLDLDDQHDPDTGTTR